MIRVNVKGQGHQRELKLSPSVFYCNRKSVDLTSFVVRIDVPGISAYEQTKFAYFFNAILPKTMGQAPECPKLRIFKRL